MGPGWAPSQEKNRRRGRGVGETSDWSWEAADVSGVEDEEEFLRGAGVGNRGAVTGGLQEVCKSLADQDESPENGV